MSHTQKESHRSGRIGWLRAVVLGANDGTISVASLVVGVAVSGAPIGERSQWGSPLALVSSSARLCRWF